jgi:AraC-like DNA-binding protein
VPGSHHQERILPTGECALLVDLSGAGNAGLSGPQSEPFVIEVAAQCRVAGVQFEAGGAFPFFAVPLSDLRNRHVVLAGLWGDLAAELRERVLASRTSPERLDVMEAVLLSRLRAGRSLHPAVAFGITQLRQGTAPIADVVARIGLSHRRFLELFEAQVGLTPKRFARVRRFQRVLHTLHHGGRIDWATVAVSCGYYDQAHCIHDFVEFAGVSPTTYLGSRGAHPNHVPL